MSQPHLHLVRWLVPDGSRVRRGEVICEIESAQASMEVEAFKDGILQHLKREGDACDTTDDIARIDDA
jgi:pyruvate/2-oxoglutarate dehydrogenase complex dihydrolipoamide acyltransferase (E2) component